MTILLDTRAKGTNKERASSAEGNGGTAGILLNLDMVSTSYYAVYVRQSSTYWLAFPIHGIIYRDFSAFVYVFIVLCPFSVGSSQQNLSLQVDTGSSDLWIASKSCSSASCSATSGRLYDPSSSQSTGDTFTMEYLSGTVSGTIVWDQVQIGGYTIPNQALGQPIHYVCLIDFSLTPATAAATTVNNEPLSYNFDGILGLALPLNSIIQQSIPATIGDGPDGAPISSNLFSLTPTTEAPSQSFLSLSLARPGFTQIPSLLGIGRHPADIVPDPSKIRYSSLVSESLGTLFWKTTIRAITVYVNGQAHPIALQSLSGASGPTALLDSGVPLILTTPVLANGIYGALGIGPASDGNYYVPCATPLNMTITLNGQNELPLHPLDLTVEPAGESNSQYCTGLIQTDPSQLTSTSDIGDMILGVPFMRNVYTVMAYEQPNATGVFNNSVNLGTNPTLGLLGLTNVTQALEEFDQVRVLKQSLGDGSSSQNLNSQGGGSQLSVGVKILFGLLGFFALSVLLFAMRCLISRRQWRKSPPVRQAAEDSDQKVYGAYRSTRTDSRSSLDQNTLLNNVSRMRKSSQHTLDSGRTRVADDYEFAAWKSKVDTLTTEPEIDDPWDPHAGTWRDTIIGTEAGEAASPHSSYFPPIDEADSSPHTSPELTSALLMAHDTNESQTNDDVAEFGMAGGMAGIGTVARGSMIGPDLRLGRSSSDSVKSGGRLRSTTTSSLRLSHTPASLREPGDASSDV
ncbi:aspartic peptidase domain-containing protein [Chiua virens]|nr:aspartic peptidase domain-containing protein [Chiua virens]